MTPVTLIIVDDHPIFRTGLKEVLERQDDVRVVGEAGDGAEALALIQAARPDIALMDIDLPKLDGLQVVSRVRELGLPTRIVVLTAHKQPEFFNAFMDADVAGYLLKENAATELIACLRSVARHEPYVSPSLTRMLLARRESAAELRRQRPGLHLLTPAESRILKLIAEDKTTKEIASMLGISPNTVDNHRANISQKIGLQGTHSLLKFAFENKSRLG